MIKCHVVCFVDNYILNKCESLKKTILTNYIFSKGNTTSAIVVFSSAK